MKEILLSAILAFLLCAYSVTAAVEITIEYGDIGTTTTTIAGTSPGSPGSSGPSGYLPPDVELESGPSMSYVMIDAEASIYENDTLTTYLKLTNQGDLNLTEINIEILGLDSDWIMYTPKYIESLSPGAYSNVIITLYGNEVGYYPYTINVTSNEANQTIQGYIEVKELTSDVIQERENAAKKQEEINDLENMMDTLIIPVLIAIGVIAPIIIAVYMIVFVLVKRCPICGSKMDFLKKYDDMFVYKCPKCGRFETKRNKQWFDH